MFKVGIIGCGMIAGEYEELEGATVYSHGKAFYKNPVFEIKGFHDIDLTKAESLAKKFGGKAFHKIDQLLENIIPDVISICTPDYSHADILVSILKNKNHPSVIFVEKPICITPQELKKIKKAQSKTDTEIVVNHSRRFDSGHIELETLISKKKLGQLIQGHVLYYGGWQHIGVHLVDILQFFFKTQMRLEKATFGCEGKTSNDPTLDISGYINKSPIFFISFPEKHYQIIELNLLFSKGQIKIENFGQEITIFNQTINNENESVLVKNKNLFFQHSETPITNAVSLIQKYLDSKNKNLFNNVGLLEAEKTINTIWKGMKIYDNKS